LQQGGKSTRFWVFEPYYFQMKIAAAIQQLFASDFVPKNSIFEILFGEAKNQKLLWHLKVSFTKQVSLLLHICVVVATRPSLLFCFS
jgi:hypothetical protein